VSSSLVLVSENTGGLHDIVGTSLSPWDFLRVPNEKAEDQTSVSQQ
jgi:hypothetical protein